MILPPRQHAQIGQLTKPGRFASVGGSLWCSAAAVVLMARVGGASTLTNAPVNLLALREAGKAELLSILDSVGR